jgi:hypothetical protein
MNKLNGSRAPVLAACVVAAGLAWPVLSTPGSEEPPGGFPADQLGRLHRLIKPQPGEHPGETP